MGVIMGTAAYMSPEQAKGKPVDHRADIWAFGVVLYEMLTGQRAFDGETVSETLADVMKTDPNWERLPAGVPAVLDNILRRCLQRDPHQRVRDVGDVRLAMDGAFETTAITASEPIIVSRGLWQRPFLLVILGLVVATVAGLAGWSVRGPEVVRADLMRFTIVPRESAPLKTDGGGVLAISPDGSDVVYASDAPDGATQLYRRSVDELVGVPLRGALAVECKYVVH